MVGFTSGVITAHPYRAPPPPPLSPVLHALDIDTQYVLTTLPRRILCHWTTRSLASTRRPTRIVVAPMSAGITYHQSKFFFGQSGGIVKQDQIRSLNNSHFLQRVVSMAAMVACLQAPTGLVCATRRQCAARRAAAVRPRARATGAVRCRGGTSTER